MKLTRLKWLALLASSYFHVFFTDNVYAQTDQRLPRNAVSQGDTTIFGKNMAISADRLLSGRVSGVKVTATTGNPMGAITTNIRGINSLRGNSDPLWVVDGVELNRSQLDTEPMFWQYASEDYSSPTNSLVNINPADIETIEVLKSTAATALFGAKGANGVIVIKTKQSKDTTTRITWNSNTTFSSPVRNEAGMLDLSSYKSFITEAGLDASGITGDNINWADEAFKKTRVSHNHHISVSGSERQYKYYVGAYFKKINGVLEGDNASVGGAQINVDLNVNKFIKMGSRVSMSYTSADLTKGAQMYGQGSSLSSILSGVPQAGSTFNTYRGWSQDYDDANTEFRIISSAFVNVTIAKGLKFNLNGGLDSRNKDRATWLGANTPFGAEYNGAASVANLNAMRYNANGVFSYSNLFAKKHLLNALVGVDVWGSRNILNVINGSNFPIHDLRSKGIVLAESKATPYKFYINNGQLGTFAQVGYDFKKKYGVSAAIRMDKASDYEDSYNQYPSVKGYWSIKEEDFLKNSKKLSALLVRAGWGKAGYNRAEPMPFFNRYYTATAPDVNPSLAAYHKTFWKLKSEEFTAGLELGLWNDRLTFSATYYDKKTNDALYLYRFGKEVGSVGNWIFDERSTFTEDVASLRNRGYEFDLRGVIIKKQEFGWQASVNLAINENSVESVSPGTLLGQSIGTFQVNYNQVGSRVSSLYGFRTNGLVTSANIATAPTVFGANAVIGDVYYVDGDGSGNIDNLDRRIIGRPVPKLFGGFFNHLAYKKFSLDFTIEAAAGFDLLNLDKMMQTDMSGMYGNVTREAYNSAGVTTGRVGSANLVSDRFIEKGDYLRLTNVMLSRSFVLKKVKWIKALNVNLAACNLLTVTSFKGLNPDVNSFGVDNSRLGIAYGAYPTVRNFTIGIGFIF